MKTGVIIGRFQVPELTIGHKALLVKAYEMFDQVGILLGYSDKPNAHNPLNVAMRRQLVEEYCPIFIDCVRDCPGNDVFWSENVDRRIYHWQEERGGLGVITLVGGRQSFVPHYHGKYQTMEIPIWLGKSGTQIRQEVCGAAPIDSADFRKGVIWAVTNYGN